MRLSDSQRERAHRAVERGDVVGLRQMCKQYPQLLEGAEGLLHLAAREGQGAVCEELLRLGVDVERVSTFFETTALTLAAGRRRVGVARLLLSRGARVDATSISVFSPLMAAAGIGWDEGARLLVSAGADLDRDSLARPETALGRAEDPPPNTDGSHAKVAEYLRSVGATKPWDYHRPDTFWDGALGELTLLFVESCLGLTHAKPVGESKSEHATIHIRRARHGKDNIFQTLYSAGLPEQGGHCEVGVCLTSKWPLHRRALEEERFRRPVDFLTTVSDRILQGAPLKHGDLLGREHELVRGLDWPGDFEQWIAVRHDSFEARRKEVRDPALPKVLLLIPHLGKKPIKTAKEAKTIADYKAQVKWEKPAASGAKNNLVVPLCYDAPWLNGRWY